MDGSSLSVWMLGAAYLGANVLGLSAYLPQIWQVCRRRQARMEVVLCTWWMWALGGLSEWLYATWVAHETLWGMVAALHALACSAVALLASWERWKAWRAPRVADLRSMSPLVG